MEIHNRYSQGMGEKKNQISQAIKRGTWGPKADELIKKMGESGYEYNIYRIQENRY